MKIDMELVRRLLPRFIKYFLAGLCCAFVSWSVFYVLNYKLCVYYLSAAVLSWVAGALVNFTLSCIVFKSIENRTRGTEFVMVITAALIGLAIDLGATAFCVRVLGLPNIVSKVAGTGVAFLFNYTSRQFFIFSRV